jgi:hypothetical protein
VPYLRRLVAGLLAAAAARIRSHVRSRGISGGQSGTRAGFLLILRFPLSILIPPIAPHSSIALGRRTK